MFFLFQVKLDLFEGGESQTPDMGADVRRLRGSRGYNHEGGLVKAEAGAGADSGRQLQSTTKVWCAG